MDDHPHLLKILLTNHLATDSSAVTYLSYVLSTLTPESLSPSAHTQKWTARLAALMHAKDPGARWAGLVLALKTARLTKALVMSQAQAWIAVSLPMLSKAEPTPILKAGMRLLAYIVSAAAPDAPEFQRQLASPTAPKLTGALIGIAEKHGGGADTELTCLTLRTLTQLLTTHPTALKLHQSALHALSLRHLSGRAPLPTDGTLLSCAAALYAALPLMGGRVGAAAAWRKEVDETIAFAWEALGAVRTSSDGRPPSREDPLVWVPLNVDRLRCAAAVLSELLRFTYTRPVAVPVSHLAKLVHALLIATPVGAQTADSQAEPTLRALEDAAVPALWRAGTDILSALAPALHEHLTPYATRLLSAMAFHLEQPSLPASARAAFFTALHTFLTHTHTPHHAHIPTRLTKAALATVSTLLPSSSSAVEEAEKITGGKGGKKGKKRARELEGEEVLRHASSVPAPTRDAGEALLRALDVMRPLLRNPHVARPTASLAARVLLAIDMSPPAYIAPAPDADLRAEVLRRVRALCVDLSLGVGGLAERSLPLVVGGAGTEGRRNDETERALERGVHPRLPPVVRALPALDTLALFRDEEGKEERTLREANGLVTAVEVTRRVEDADASVPDETQPSLLLPPPKQTAVPVQDTQNIPAGPSSRFSVTNQHVVPPPSAFTAAAGAPTVRPTPMPAEPAPILAPTPAPALTTLAAPTPSAPLPSTFLTSPVMAAERMDTDDEDEPMPPIDVNSDTDEED